MKSLDLNSSNFLIIVGSFNNEYNLGFSLYQLKPAEKVIIHKNQNIEAITNNVAPNTQLWPVIKDDAYGHGAITIAKRLAPPSSWILRSSPVGGGHPSRGWY